MNLNPIKSIYNFNKEAGLLDAGYDDERECAYPIEEALEGFDLRELAFQIEYINHARFIDKEPLDKDMAKQLSRYISEGAVATYDDGSYGDDVIPPPQKLKDIDRFDKHLDILVFTFGSMFKMGLSVQQVMKGLQVVATANMQKLKAGKDEHGKQMKPADFVSPEPLLQLILDERKE